MNKEIFKVGDSVYCALFGWGVVSNIDESTIYPICVDFKNDSNISYTFNGRYYKNSKQTLSFTEYILENFSQERPVELPKVGELCLVRDKDHHSWIVKEFVDYKPKCEFPYITEYDVPYAQLKRIKILD
jgi:hypothetical protein